MRDIPAPLVDYVKQLGYGKTAIRPTFTVQGFGGMRASGLRRVKYRYYNGQRETIEEE